MLRSVGAFGLRLLLVGIHRRLCSNPAGRAPSVEAALTGGFLAGEDDVSCARAGIMRGEPTSCRGTPRRVRLRLTLAISAVVGAGAVPASRARSRAGVVWGVALTSVKESRTPAGGIVDPSGARTVPSCA